VIDASRESFLDVRPLSQEYFSLKLRMTFNRTSQAWFICAGNHG